MAYCEMDNEEAKNHKPKVVFVDDNNNADGNNNNNNKQEHNSKLKFYSLTGKKKLLRLLFRSKHHLHYGNCFFDYVSFISGS